MSQSAASFPQRIETPTLVSFSVFNPNISQGEDDAEENVLWFHPTETPVGQRLRVVGLCTAFTTLSTTFGTDALQHASMDNHRYVVLQVEPDFWFLVVFRRVAAEDDAALLEDRDDCLVAGIRTVLRRCYAIMNITMGSLGAVLGREVEAVRKEDAAEVAATGKRPIKERYLATHAARRLAQRIAPLCRDFSVALSNLVASPRGSFAVRSGLDYLVINQAGHLQVGSLTRRLHNAHPGTIAHSVLVVQPNYLAFSTLGNELTSTLLNFVHAAEGNQRDAIVPQAVFVERWGKPIVLRGKDAIAYCNAVHALPVPRSEVTPTDAHAAASTAREWMRKLTSRFGSSDSSSNQQLAIAIEATKETEQEAVIAHDARTQCYIDDVLMGIMCFTLGPLSLYCLVEDKFCQHDLLRQGLVESVAAILLEERNMLAGTSHVTRALTAGMETIGQQAMFAYRNMAINASKMSSHFRRDDQCVGKIAETAILLDRLRDAACRSSHDETAALAARLQDTVWGFAERYGQRDFSFALTGYRAQPEMAAAFSQAEEVRVNCLVGLHRD